MTDAIREPRTLFVERRQVALQCVAHLRSAGLHDEADEAEQVISVLSDIVDHTAAAS